MTLARSTVVAVAVFLASAAVVVAWCASMAAAPMRMAGGRTMSMAWMRMADQSWPGACASFLAMWTAMMVAMMTPSFARMAHRWRRSVVRAGGRAAGAAGATGAAGSVPARHLIAVLAAGYLAVWTLVGVVLYPAGVALAAAEMRWPALAAQIPLASAVVVVAAGCVELTPWKARQIWCCKDAPCCRVARPADARRAWRDGLALGRHCALCCAPLMAILVVAGVMDLGAMALVTAAITYERYAVDPTRSARVVGVLAIAIGVAWACVSSR